MKADGATIEATSKRDDVIDFEASDTGRSVEVLDRRMLPASPQPPWGSGFAA